MTARNNVKAIIMHKSLCKSAGPALNYAISQDWAPPQTGNDDRLALTRLSFPSIIGILIESANLPSAFPKVFDNIQILTITMGTLRSACLGVLYSVSTTNLALFYPQEK